MKEHTKYRIEGYCTADGIGKGYDASSEADTLKEAKEKARYMLTKEHRAACEASEPLTVARVMRVLGGDEDKDEFVWQVEAKKKGFRFNPDKCDEDQPEGPSNGHRAENAEFGVKTACLSRGEHPSVDEDSIRDIMADLCHLCDREGLNPVKLFNTAKRDWLAER
ncbi:MAG: hypothetical protein BWY66_00388 [bacterium ADurb.Bin374]|nr:MAG: hypothetical protein BWY66_00388 [bacterium ADurb.Bin374]